MRQTAGVERPKSAVSSQQKARRATRPQSELKTASISKEPKPAPRPETAKTTAKPSPATSLNVLYTSTTAYLRKRPETASPVLHKLKQGESVRVFARDGNWTLVSASGRKGWLHDDVLKPADPAAPRPKEALAAPARPANPG
ncbi:SH3 domain-containing protein [Aminobacter sp. HY435]|uniref:SH3 domain-containing protein n=1 Tax=Aminobacter sp. HY435 TaxID=2970917 RepID=UPI0022B9B81F|nr:SH3 domain-containing protein [Aminobacter sp. HY435]